MDKTNWQIRYYVQISFFVMILFWVLSVWFDNVNPENITNNIYWGLSWIAITIFCFVNSIRYIIAYKKKAFGITALVVSSILILLFLIGFGLGVVLK